MVSLSSLASDLSLTPLTGEGAHPAFDGVYVGDLLSRAMGRIRSRNLWITIMTNKNVIAVASLTDAAAVILAEGAEPLPEAIQAAKENGVPVYSSPLTAYEICSRIARRAEA